LKQERVKNDHIKCNMVGLNCHVFTVT